MLSQVEAASLFPPHVWGFAFALSLDSDVHMIIAADLDITSSHCRIHRERKREPFLFGVLLENIEG